jgi:hypothetical protein
MFIFSLPRGGPENPEIPRQPILMTLYELINPCSVEPLIAVRRAAQADWSKASPAMRLF